MKILIAYDGSDCARAAIDDLVLAGLPRVAQARLVTVAEIQPEVVGSTLDPGYSSSFMTSQLAVENTQALTEAAERQSATVGDEGAQRLGTLFPGWTLERSTRSDSPAAGILDEAEQWQADLVVVGSHGRSAVARVFFGSVSQNVVKDARTSVRVARGWAAREAGPARILVAFDGSPEARATLDALTRREWPAGTQARILTVWDARLAGAFPDAPGEDLAKSLQESGRLAAERLQAIGVNGQPLVRRGDPKREILAEAEQWKADCIFIGTPGLGAPRRFLLGTLASAVVSHAPCSVEVVRT